MYLQGPLDDGRTGIYRSKRTKIGAAWSKPEPVTALNHPEAKRGDMSPCLAGDKLYFASDRPGGKGGMDLWSVSLMQLSSRLAKLLTAAAPTASGCCRAEAALPALAVTGEG